MARTTFTTDHLLDCTREVILARGPRGATVAAIAAAAGAPTGSIYHRFRSVDELLARTWLRAVRRTHAVAPAGPGGSSPEGSSPEGSSPEGSSPEGEDPAGLAARYALAMYDHCVAEPRDVLLLDKLHHTDIATMNLDPALRAEVDHAVADTAAALRRAARAVYGRAGQAEVDLVTLAVVDLPLAFAHRHLAAGATPPAHRRARLALAVRAVLDGG